MNKERYNQIIDEAWNSYRQQTMFESNPKWLEPVSVMDMKTGEMSMCISIQSQKEMGLSRLHFIS